MFFSAELLSKRFTSDKTAGRLRGAGLDIADPEIIARTNPQGPYSLVSLFIGVNNQYQGRSVESYAPEFSGLAKRAIGFTSGEPGRVLVLSIPDWGATPFGQSNDPARVGRQIDAFNAVNLAVSEELRVRYVDVTAVSRLATKEPELVAGDRLHPSGKMYARWAELALPAALAAFDKSRETSGTSGR